MTVTDSAHVCIITGQRWSAACAYLHPSLSRPNLTALNGALATRVLFEGTRAVGVEYERNGNIERAYADKEVILSGGAINSPQLLLLSGVGDEKHLKSMDIPVVTHRPGVGQNLQDHLEIYVQQACSQPITLYRAQKPLRMLAIGIEWMLKFTGQGSSAHLHTGGFIRSAPGVLHPDVQFHFLPSQVIDHGRTSPTAEAYQVHVGPMRPTSRGWIKLNSRDPREHPVIEANYLTTKQDVWEVRQCVKMSREVFAQPAFNHFRGREIRPGPEVNSDAEIDAAVRTLADSAYHPSCTCKMGDPEDPTTVVDPETRVIGIEGLRVVDASIMPSIVSGNLNAPTIMLAEKAADIIRGLAPLPPCHVPVYSPPTLETQR
uniref:Choline dehydrogenase n=1 Tax=Eptatretus burgeri TaxID=7764 RepID=A0A8C4X0E7_EPTBU